MSEQVDLESIYDARIQDEWKLGERDRLFMGGQVTDHCGRQMRVRMEVGF